MPVTLGCKSSPFVRRAKKIRKLSPDGGGSGTKIRKRGYEGDYSGKGKAVPLHALEALGGRGGIAPTHSRPRH
jgi:hypothetical protein